MNASYYTGEWLNIKSQLKIRVDLSARVAVSLDASGYDCRKLRGNCWSFSPLTCLLIGFIQLVQELLHLNIDSINMISANTDPHEMLPLCTVEYKREENICC